MKHWKCPTCGRIRVTPDDAPPQHCVQLDHQAKMILQQGGIPMVEEAKVPPPGDQDVPPADEELAPIPDTMPQGGREAGGLPDWWPDDGFKKGALVTGILTGAMDIKGKQRWKFRAGGWQGKEYVLPDHVDLDRKLQDVFDVTGVPARIVILYRGRAKIEGVATPMMQYFVKDYGTEKKPQ